MSDEWVHYKTVLHESYNTEHPVEQTGKRGRSRKLEIILDPELISNLTQGMFVGAISDNFDERIEQKIFHAEIVVDNVAVSHETKAYKRIPDILDFRDKEGNDIHACGNRTEL